MKLELQSASNFIVHLIRMNQKNNIGEGKLFKFGKCLINELKIRYRDHWFPEKPQKSSGYRCIRCYDKLDPFIIRAGEACGLSAVFLKETFPEFMLWIDPKEVTYRFGENGPICVIFSHEDLTPWTHKRTVKQKHQQDSFKWLKNITKTFKC